MIPASQHPSDHLTVIIVDHTYPDIGPASHNGPKMTEYGALSSREIFPKDFIIANDDMHFH